MLKVQIFISKDSKVTRIRAIDIFIVVVDENKFTSFRARQKEILSS